MYTAAVYTAAPSCRPHAPLHTRISMPASIFIVGATGFQGSTLVQALLEQDEAYKITIMSRSESSAAPYKEKGCGVLIGDFEATNVMQQGAKDADVVFSLASADDLPPVQALVEALRPKGAARVRLTSGVAACSRRPAHNGSKTL